MDPFLPVLMDRLAAALFGGATLAAVLMVRASRPAGE